MLKHRVSYERADRVQLAFDRFRREEVDLPPNQFRGGHRVVSAVVAILEKTSGTKGLPDIVEGAGLAAGAFGRGTATHPLRRIQILAVLDGSRLRGEKLDGSERLEIEGGLPGMLATDPGLVEGSALSARLVARRFVEPLAMVATLGWGYGIAEEDCTAFVQAPDLRIDIVPAVLAPAGIGSPGERYFVPAGQDGRDWRAVNPRLERQWLHQEDARQGGRLLPILRLLNWWNAHQNAGRLDDLHLETLATRALRGADLDPVGPALARLLAALPERLRQPCPDPTGLGGLLDAELTMERRLASEHALADAARQSEHAVVAGAAGDVEQALRSWRRLFPLSSRATHVGAPPQGVALSATTATGAPDGPAGEGRE